ncbi:MAG: transcription termination factor NusA [Monoglobales bacterium]|jgi:N utilization substance protein A
MNKELLEALQTLCEEKGISPDVIFEALEAALVSAYKKNFNSLQNVAVNIDRAKGKVVVMAQKKVVEEVYDDQEEISLEDARKISGSYQYGDTVNIEVTPKNFGRIAATTAKQVVTQRIREAERGIIYSEYTDKTNDIVTGVVDRIENGNVFVDIGKLEAMLPEKERPAGETYEIHQQIKCYVSAVKNGTKGTQIMISRTHPGLVRKLFELEVPEIEKGIVEIKSVAREAGSRTKIAVWSNDPNVDAQGACIGPKGIRVQNIGDELRNEKIDIVKWSEDPAEFISASLSPSKVLSVEINEEEKSAKVTVPEHQLSLAIGKSGQNVRLAARLTGWKIDISASDEQ